MSYRPLNKITLGFEFPIPRCADSIEDLGDSCGPIFTISLDARSGYHQIRVRKSDQEKLAFFTPSGDKKTYKVLPFGPTNAPSFYTAMMQALRKEWVLLFADTKHLLTIDSAPDTIICSDKIYVPDTIVCNDKIIIDDILLYSNNVDTLIHYFSCVAQVFTKYRLSFKLTKCEFLKPRVEFVGHDLTTYGNCPAASKFELIKTWPLPPHAISLLSFIGLCSFYSRYCPWFETNVKPLRKLQRAYHRQAIPILSWTPPLISLFNDCKDRLVSSPLLLRYDSTKPIFLKTDWSAGGMGYILMQADDTPQSVAAIKLLEETGECTFDLSVDGPRLRPVFFG